MSWVREFVERASNNTPLEAWRRRIDKLEMDRERFVYFIQTMPGSPIKIGSTESPAKRLSGLQTGIPDKLIVLGTAYGGPGLESELHQILAGDCKRGEWFHPTVKVVTVIYGVLSGRWHASGTIEALPEFIRRVQNK